MYTTFYSTEYPSIPLASSLFRYTVLLIVNYEKRLIKMNYEVWDTASRSIWMREPEAVSDSNTAEMALRKDLFSPSEASDSIFYQKAWKPEIQ